MHFKGGKGKGGEVTEWGEGGIGKQCKNEEQRKVGERVEMRGKGQRRGAMRRILGGSVDSAQRMGTRREESGRTSCEKREWAEARSDEENSGGSRDSAQRKCTANGEHEKEVGV